MVVRVARLRFKASIFCLCLQVCILLPMEKKIADSEIGYLLKYGAVRLSVSQIGAIVQFVVTVVHAVNHSG